MEIGEVFRFYNDTVKVLYSEINGLTINVEKDSSLNTSNTIEGTSTVELKGDTIIKGVGKLSVYGSHHWNAGSCDAVRISENMTLTISNMDSNKRKATNIKSDGCY